MFQPGQSRRSSIGVAAVAVAMVAAACASSEGDAAAHRPSAARVDGVVAIVHRTPSCGCCKSWEAYLRKHGYRVRSVVTEGIDRVASERGIPDDARGCHTAEIDGYVVEGHVPVEAIAKLRRDRPSIDGIAVPGMPSNSPGMGGPNGEPLEVLAVDQGVTSSFMSVT